MECKDTCARFYNVAPNGTKTCTTVCTNFAEKPDKDGLSKCVDDCS